jgi:hypothetical protein
VAKRSPVDGDARHPFVAIGIVGSDGRTIAEAIVREMHALRARSGTGGGAGRCACGIENAVLPARDTDRPGKRF